MDEFLRDCEWTGKKQWKGIIWKKRHSQHNQRVFVHVKSIIGQADEECDSDGYVSRMTELNASFVRAINEDWNDKIADEVIGSN